MENSVESWRKCSTCKKDIGFNKKHYVCSVSTCNGQRTGYVFCSVVCFEAHVPGAKHRDAAAIEAVSPTANTASSPVRKIITGQPSNALNTNQGFGGKQSPIPRDVLIVASKLKDYIKARADMSTSASVMDILSDSVRRLCDDAIDKARQEGRKTVLDRDFKR